MLRIIALGTICVFFFAFPFAGTLPEVGAVASLVEGFGRSLKFVPVSPSRSGGGEYASALRGVRHP